MQSQSIIITRQQIGHWASFVGGAALVAAVIGLLWQRELTNIILALFAVAVVGIAAWALLSTQEFINFITGRQVRYSTTAVFSTLLLIGVVSLVFIITQRAVITLDLTDTQLFTLSNETLAVLDGVSREIQITAFYSSEALQQRELDDQFFRLYEDATNGMIRREYIDPDKQPGIAARFPDSRDGSVYISYLTPDGQIDFNTLARVPRGARQERDMTQAISRLLISGTLTVFFELSHGEYDPLDGSQIGLSGINNGVQESGLVTAPLNLLAIASQGGSIPTVASTVIMARPTSDLSESEIAVLDDYLQQGGTLMILTDPQIRENAFLQEDGLFNQYLWENYGLRALDAVVVDEVASAQTQLDIMSAAVFTVTDIGARLDPATTPTIFRVARPLEVNDTPPPNVANGRVIMSSERSYGETNLRDVLEANEFEPNPEEDILGPLTTVAWAWNQENDSRILLVGDADFVTNGQVVLGGNGILFTDGVTWLTGLGEQIHFTPQPIFTGLPLIIVRGPSMGLIRLITIVILPGVVLLIGLGVWTRRSRR
ncbi:MAG: hypothetical protein D6737_08275 [Chloroflexi bacterium]|nr:MAG: hypothetical protein CUN54_03660 [Phototrophicales bacterium]RMF80367.1 MAG: hypothetical protein D6737_08275 [Chloroflexota bacterium]